MRQVPRINIQDLQRKKTAGEKITFLTCYDYPSAMIVSDTALDGVLVGDSVSMAVHGHPNTTMATLEMMRLHTEAVHRGLKGPLLLTDLPFLAHRESRSETIKNVRQLIQAGAEAIKIEGCDAFTCELITHLTSAGIPIFGHIGLTPQFIHQLGGYKIQGKNDSSAEQLLKDAKALEAAGCAALVIECVPGEVAKTITEALTIPTIGIGASHHTDGQILVWQDMLGLQNEFKPRFLKEFANGRALCLDAIHAYIHEVKAEHYPAAIHAYSR